MGKRKGVVIAKGPERVSKKKRNNHHNSMR